MTRAATLSLAALSDELADLHAAFAQLDFCRRLVEDERDPMWTPYAVTRLTRAQAHLERRLTAYFGDRVPITTEQAALTVVRALAEELRTAGQALEAAARALRDDGKGYRASQAYQAAQRALRAAEEAGA